MSFDTVGEPMHARINNQYGVGLMTNTVNEVKIVSTPTKPTSKRFRQLAYMAD